MPKFGEYIGDIQCASDVKGGFRCGRRSLSRRRLENRKRLIVQEPKEIDGGRGLAVL